MAFEDFFHILNPNAARRDKVRAVFDAKSRAQAVWIDRSSHPYHLETAVNWALMENRADIAVWGGDGTWGRVLNALHEKDALSKVRVTLVPVGTCNDFARKMGLACWRRAADSLDGPMAARKLDAGLLHWEGGRRLFMNNSGFGRRPGAFARARSNPLLDILSFRRHHLQVESQKAVDATGSTPGLYVGAAGQSRFGGADPLATLPPTAQRRNMDALFGIVFNAPYFSCGLHFDENVSPDDGTLNAFFLQPMMKLSLLWRFARARRGTGCLTGPGVERINGASLRVTSDIPMHPQVDGDAVAALAESGAMRLSYSVLRGAVSFLTQK